MPSAATTQRARTSRSSAPSAPIRSTTAFDSSRAAVSPAPSTTVAPSLRATSTSAASRSRRVVTAANRPSEAGGRGRWMLTPLGEVTKQSVTSIHEATSAGSRPSCSSWRSARVVRPSPQVLSRGKVALSKTVTSMPARARVMAAAVPAGPAPMTATSICSSAGSTARRLVPAPGAPDPVGGGPVRSGAGGRRHRLAGVAFDHRLQHGVDRGDQVVVQGDLRGHDVLGQLLGS